MNDITNLLIMLGGIVLFVTVIVALDAIGRRRRRDAEKMQYRRA